MIVQVVTPNYPHQVWFIGNLTCGDGVAWAGAMTKERAKEFKTFTEIGEMLEKFVARFPTKQVIIHM